MQHIVTYQSPLGEILLAADDIGLTGLWFEGQKYYACGLDREHDQEKVPIFEEVSRWLDIYFSGKEPNFMPPLHMQGTPFQREVWEMLRRIPYGGTMTYGEIAKKLAGERGLSEMSARAVGGAVGRNRISVIIPCHRVVGSGGSLTGYAGGIDRKKKLLALESVYFNNL